MRIFTIGYEGAQIEGFLSTLCEVGIERVVDVRDVPASRKRDFSKNILRAHLQDIGIEYTHFKALGDPKPGRDAMRAGKRAEFISVFSAHMKTDAAQSAMKEIAQIALDETIVLLCYERDQKDCHRTIIASELQRRHGFEVRNIGVRHGATRLGSDSHAVITGGTF